MRKGMMLFATMLCISLSSSPFIVLGGETGKITFTSELNRDLHPILHSDTGAAVDKNQAEKDMLALLSKYPDKKSQGQIYAALGEMFYPFQVAKTWDNKDYLEKSILYTKKAIDLPLPTRRKLELYQQWGGLETYKPGKNGTLEMKSIIVQAWLQGLKFAKEQQIPDTKPDEIKYTGKLRKEMSTLDGRVMAIGTQAEKEEFEKQREAKDKRVAKALANAHARQELIKAFEIKEGIERSIVDVYINQPDAVEALRQQAKTVTGDADIAERLANLLTKAQETKAAQIEYEKNAAKTPGFHPPFVAP